MLMSSGEDAGAWMAHVDTDSVPDMLALADQGATRASLCFWYDVGSLGRRWGPTGPLLCDLTSWRITYKAFHHMGQPVEM